jgi:hypothetical protein
MEVKTVEREIEKVMTFKWEMRSSVFSKIQTKFAEKLNDFLKKSPEAQIVIRPQQYTAKEKEYILFFEAKKKYLEASKIIPGSNISSSDSDKINKMSVKDSLFVNYLDKQTKDSLIFSIQDKCSKLISASEVEKKYKLLTASRKAYFLSFFTDEEQKKQIVFKEDHNTIPYNGFSFYKIEYKNEIPDYLKKAYEKLKELNDEAPRKEFEAKRKSQKKA